MEFEKLHEAIPVWRRMIAATAARRAAIRAGAAAVRQGARDTRRTAHVERNRSMLAQQRSLQLRIVQDQLQLQRALVG